MRKQVAGNIVDIHKRRIFHGEVEVEGRSIREVRETGSGENHFILPGFVDAHVHVESSLVTPVEFARCAVRHGSIGAISDPHEIANVMGMEGVKFMVENGKETPFRFLFGAPSCVPATDMECSGAVLDAKNIGELLQMEGVGFLAEMMNFPGVIRKDPEIYKKLQEAKKRGLPIDGHAPGLGGMDLVTYAKAGVGTDHECTQIEEAREKLAAGMKILIREGSGARNFNMLIPLMDEAPDSLMFCTDDIHPDELAKGHINQLVKRAIRSGYDLFDVLRAASLNPVTHYGLNMGLLRQGDPADFIIVEDLDQMNVRSTHIEGEEVFSRKQVRIPSIRTPALVRMADKMISAEDLCVKREADQMWIMEAMDGSLYTEKKLVRLPNDSQKVLSNVNEDILKIAVVNRYQSGTKPSLGFIRGFGLKKGAIVSSVAHDSHHVICVGAGDDAMAGAINWVFSRKGGIAVHDGEEIIGMPLEVAGLMTGLTVEDAGKKYQDLNDRVSRLGSPIQAPLITLSFMALLVIPSLKIGDRGLFDVEKFSTIPLFRKEI